MKNILVDQEGALRCPSCKGTNFDLKRSFKAKVTFGVGALLLPKRIKCLGCGLMCKGGNAEQWVDPAKRVASAPRPSSQRVASNPQADDWTRGMSTADIRQLEELRSRAASSADDAESDAKECPMCAETVKSKALVCRFCGHSFDVVD